MHSIPCTARRSIQAALAQRSGGARPVAVGPDCARRRPTARARQVVRRMYAAADRLTVLPPTLELRVLPRVESATEPASLVLGDDSAGRPPRAHALRATARATAGRRARWSRDGRRRGPRALLLTRRSRAAASTARAPRRLRPRRSPKAARGRQLHSELRRALPYGRFLAELVADVVECLMVVCFLPSGKRTRV